MPLKHVSECLSLQDLLSPPQQCIRIRLLQFLLVLFKRYIEWQRAKGH